MHSPAGSAAVRSESQRHGAPAFRWSWKLVTIAGIDVYVHGTLLLLIAFVAFSDLVAGQGVTAMVRGTLFILAVFTTVALGELVALEAAANTGGGTGR